MEKYLENLGSIMNFGKFKGFTIEEILIINPSYFHWCLNNIPDLYFSEELYREIISFFPDFIFFKHYDRHLRNSNDSDVLK